MKALGSAALLLVASAIALPQSTWVWQNPLPQGNFLAGTCLIDQSTFVCVGASGTILRTTDRGMHWDLQQYVGGWGVPLNGVSFSGPDNGIVVGDSGIIHRTTNGGQTWMTQQESNPVTLNGVCHLSQRTIIVVGDGGIILRSSDGGGCWDVQPSRTSQPLYGVSFADSSSGFAVGDPGVILASTDGGMTWLDRSFGAMVRIKAVSSPQPGVATIVGDLGMIARTRNGGINWELHLGWTGIDLSTVWFADTSKGITAGGGINLAPTILRTTDAGQTWLSSSPDPLETRLTCLSFIRMDIGVAVGFNYIFFTLDGGSSWTDLSRRATVFYEYLGCVAFCDKDHGMIEGEYGLLKTSDGGATWLRSQSGGGGVAISMPTRSVAVAVGYDGFHGYNFQRTTDGGNTWTPGTAGGRTPLDGVSFSNANCGVVMGNHPVRSNILLTTTDGCETWVQRNTGTTLFLTDLHMADPLHCYVVGDSGTILYTSDGGESWIAESSGTKLILEAVSAPDYRNATVVGESGLILRTADEGHTWSPQSSGTTEWLSDVSFVDSAYGMAVGGWGTVLRTSNAGASWETCAGVPSVAPGGVFCADHNTATIIGGNGAILRTTTGGVTWVPEERRTTVLPKLASLEQNYPNPFNPATNIRYTVPAGGYRRTSLRVYDMLGREVATLVNEVKPPGTYAVRWDATGLASGVYFYRLEAGSFTSVKKLLLLK